MSLDLKGMAILVTRPQPEARGLASLVSAANGIPIIQPGVDIECAPEDDESLAALERLHEYAAVVFVSANAVRCALAARPRRDWPRGLALHAVGPRTRRSLNNAGFDNVSAPASGEGSESLLAAMQPQTLAGKRVLMMAAPGGRTLIADALSDAGVQVDWCYVYRRKAAEADPDALKWIKAHWGKLVVVATSAYILGNVGDLIPELKTRPLVVPSERLRGIARKAGWALVAVSARADDESMLEAATRFTER